MVERSSSSRSVRRAAGRSVPDPTGTERRRHGRRRLLEVAAPSETSLGHGPMPSPLISSPPVVHSGRGGRGTMVGWWRLRPGRTGRIVRPPNWTPHTSRVEHTSRYNSRASTRGTLPKLRTVAPGGGPTRPGPVRPDPMSDPHGLLRVVALHLACAALAPAVAVVRACGWAALAPVGFLAGLLRGPPALRWWRCETVSRRRRRCVRRLEHNAARQSWPATRRRLRRAALEETRES